MEVVWRWRVLALFKMDFIRILDMDFVAECRRGTLHEYDVVEGPMADDQIWNFVEDFIEERISRKAFWEIVKFNYPTHQIVFCTDEALKTLKFEGSYSL